jgi:FdhE protein
MLEHRQRMTSTRIIQPGEIERLADQDAPFLRLPPFERVFAERQARLTGLAAGHSLADFLLFCARISSAQHAIAADGPALGAPSRNHLERCREHLMPPLACAGWRRDPVWHEILRRLSTALLPDSPEATRRVIQHLIDADADWLEAQAGRILSGARSELDLAAAPLLAAALQVYWTGMATALAPADVAPSEQPGLCPVCSSHPVASVVLGSGREAGLRYLQCALCATQWHCVRIKCSNCGSTQGISYHQIEGGAEALKAETCDECRTYLKILNHEKDPLVEPVADDLASLTLDLLMSDAGYARSGVNLMLFHGDG